MSCHFVLMIIRTFIRIGQALAGILAEKKNTLPKKEK